MKDWEMCNGNGEHPGYKDITESFEKAFRVSGQLKNAVTYYSRLQSIGGTICPICGKILIEENQVEVRKNDKDNN